MHAAPLPPYCTDAEIDEICAGLTQSAAKCRFLSQVLRVPVKRKPNGRPLVLRTDLERVRVRDDDAAPAEPRSLTPSNEPNWQRKASR